VYVARWHPTPYRAGGHFMGRLRLTPVNTWAAYRAHLEYLSARARESRALWHEDVAARDAAIYRADRAGISGRTLAAWCGLTPAAVCKLLAVQARQGQAAERE
jgi:hypothetical protein